MKQNQIHRTKEEWFKTIKDAEIRSKAITNLKGSNNDKTVKEPSLTAAICSGFTWVETLEGHAYWLNVMKQFKKDKL